MTYEEKQVPYIESGIWKQVVYIYRDAGMSGHPLSSRIDTLTAEEAAAARVPEELPVQKIFDTGYIHMQFDPTSSEYKNFSADPRTAEFFNNQTVTVSRAGLEFRKGILAVLLAEGILTQATYNKVIAVVDSWLTQIQ